ncbi:MAG: hypothetical protein E6Q61_09405 [Nitrosomonas sp.]|nr:MAG: hypothetical protein E6Q61_09405 [Nitrosomonas sp.]
MENEKKDEITPSSIIEILKESLGEFLDSGIPVANFNLKIGHIKEGNFPEKFEELGIIFARGEGAHGVCEFISEFLTHSKDKKIQMEKDREDKENLH